MIELKSVVKKYGNTIALNGVSLTIQKGDFFGLLGPNGAGKSTLMNLMVTYLAADSGTISYDSVDITRDTASIKQKTGFVPQTIALYDDLSAEENLSIFGSFYQIPAPVLRARMMESLSAVGLYDRRKDKVKAFSGGMKRRLNIIASLLHKPTILLCDEPTVGIDPQSRNAIFDYLELLNREGMTIVYTTHYMEEAERMCKNIAIIDTGEIIATGTLQQLLNLYPSSGDIIVRDAQLYAECIRNTAQHYPCEFSGDDLIIKPPKELPLSGIFHALEQCGVPPLSIELRRPQLEELFLHLTGRSLRD